MTPLSTTSDLFSKRIVHAFKTQLKTLKYQTCVWQGVDKGDHLTPVIMLRDFMAYFPWIPSQWWYISCLWAVAGCWCRLVRWPHYTWPALRDGATRCPRGTSGCRNLDDVWRGPLGCCERRVPPRTGHEHRHGRRMGNHLGCCGTQQIYHKFVVHNQGWIYACA